jgi:hypothetical protein
MLPDDGAALHDMVGLIAAEPLPLTEKIQLLGDLLAFEGRLTIRRQIEPAQTCPFRKSYPDVLVMQPSQDRNGDNGARSLDCSMQGRIFL